MFRDSARRTAFFGLAAAIMLAGPLRAQEAPPLDPESPMAPLPGLGVDWPDLKADAITADPAAAAAQTTEIADEQRYRVVITGIDDLSAAARTRFDALSVLKEGEGKPANVAQIDRRARDDAELLDSVLRAEGYYDASVDTNVIPENGRLTVTLAVEPGPLYKFDQVQVSGLGTTDGKSGEFRDSFAVKADDPVNADTVVASEAAIRAKLGREGFPFAKVAEPEVVVDHDTRSATLDLNIDPGGERRFGGIKVVSQRPPFGPRHVQTIARFKPGQLYNQDQLDDLRRALIATGLVSTVKVEPVEGTAPGTVDIATTIDPAPVHTIAGELGYGTGEGFRVEASWQHRNLIRPEGAVTFRGVAGTKEQLLGAILRMGNFHKRDQVLNASVVASHDVRAAYDARSFDIAANIERQTNIIWQKKWTYSLGFELLASQERDFVQTVGQLQRRTYLIGALPATLGYDGSDNLLDPTRGYRLSGRLSPELSLQGGAFGYARAQIDASGYVPVGAGTVIAGRARVGSIIGAGRENIAPSRRFYAGGGGSVRGYSYQRIGPLNALGDPLGGRSLAEVSIEARVRLKAFGGNFGVVPFVDAGNIYTGTTPKFTGLRIGAGIGARYYSSFGPIRIDVGTPIGRRPGESRVAVYVSLGQAF